MISKKKKTKTKKISLFIVIIIAINFLLLVFLHEVAHMLIFSSYGIQSRMHFFTLGAFRNGALAYVEPVDEQQLDLLIEEDHDAFLHMNFLHALNELLTIYFMIPFLFFMTGVTCSLIFSHGKT
ncbi:MAG: hypothetical protein QW051_00265 [Candidatus Aenigmatarchaeota archaeon]